MAILIAFKWSPETEVELVALGFKRQKIYLKHLDFVWSGSLADILDSKVFSWQEYTPSQFATAPCYGGVQLTMTQIAMAWSQAAEIQLKNNDFTLVEVFTKSTSYYGPTDEQLKRGLREFKEMKSAPELYTVTSWWGAGSR